MNRRNLAAVFLVLAFVRPMLAQEAAPAEVRAAFLKTLDRPRVPLDVKVAGVDEAPGRPTVERLSFATETKADGSVERVPALVVRPGKAPGRLPAVIVLHGTGGSKESMRDWLNDLAARGFLAIAIDGRYHGQRRGGGQGTEAYNQAIVRAWRAKPGESMEHPFYFDTVWDVWRTIDYLQARSDVDPARIGLVGISKGGIEAYLAGAVDERVKAAVPAISVQSFRWGLDHDRWQGRARTVQAAHEAVARDLGEAEVDARVCRALWDKVIPGMTGPFDGPSILRLFAGRSLLILNGSEDPNCPIEGAEFAFNAARGAFRDAGCQEKLTIDVARGVGHAVTSAQRKRALEWLAKSLGATEKG